MQTILSSQTTIFSGLPVAAFEAARPISPYKYQDKALLHIPGKDHD
jgi:hypothetical protein